MHLHGGIRFEDFERLDGQPPFYVLDRHPDGRHIVMETIHEYSQVRAGVWDRKTGRLVWQP